MKTSEIDPQFEALLDYIKRNRGFDFTGYKRPSLMRRVGRRMQALNIDSYSDYLDYLEVYPAEFLPLFNTLLISVTAFFRDRPAWDYLMSTLLPWLIAQKGPGELIRVWSAGCATGEEAYTLAMAIAEVIGIEQFHSRVRIYATDVDSDALNQARQATYSGRQVSGISPDLLARYFEQFGNGYTFRKDLRRSVIFGRHDLIQDAPISKIDLLVCRNTLMYFNAETQARILSRFHFALRENGFLFLGKAEMLLTYTNTFAPIELKHRVFTKTARVNPSDRLFSPDPGPPTAADNRNFSYITQLREAAFDSSLIPQIVVDTQGRLVLVNERARSLFAIALKDLGQPLQRLELARLGDLRGTIDQVQLEGCAITLPNVEWQPLPAERLYLDIHVSLLTELKTGILGISITFTDVTRYQQLQADLEHSNRELEVAYEELQSANEELETTNEELQSTNEELETMNEELQSTNEEMQTINAELQHRSDELNQSNRFLETILTSLQGGVVVVNRELRVLIWNPKAEDLWGLRSVEALGQQFLSLDIGLPVEQLRDCLQHGLRDRSLDDRTPSSTRITLSAVNRRGKPFLCRVTSTPLVDSDQGVQGIILLMEEQAE